MTAAISEKQGDLLFRNCFKKQTGSYHYEDDIPLVWKRE